MCCWRHSFSLGQLVAHQRQLETREALTAATSESVELMAVQQKRQSSRNLCCALRQNTLVATHFAQTGQRRLDQHCCQLASSQPRRECKAARKSDAASVLLAAAKTCTVCCVCLCCNLGSRHALECARVLSVAHCNLFELGATLNVLRHTLDLDHI